MSTYVYECMYMCMYVQEILSASSKIGVKNQEAQKSPVKKDSKRFILRHTIITLSQRRRLGNLNESREGNFHIQGNVNKINTIFSRNIVLDMNKVFMENHCIPRILPIGMCSFKSKDTIDFYIQKKTKQIHYFYNSSCRKHQEQFYKLI